MGNLRKKAKGEDCMLRLPGICNYNPETTVLAHIRENNAGMGLKPPDICGFYACSACHDAYDKRSGGPGGSINMDRYVLTAHDRQLKHWLARGDIVIK